MSIYGDVVKIISVYTGRMIDDSRSKYDRKLVHSKSELKETISDNKGIYIPKLTQYLFSVVIDTNQWYHATYIHPGEISITIGSEYD